MAPIPNRNKKNAKNPSVFSHEFVIQNHGDVVSCLAMLILTGLMFEFSSPLALMFIALQHNITVNDSAGTGLTETLYNYGSRDVYGIFFYVLIAIVIHAVIQEYIFDKLNRKMHLSKVKHSKFIESGQLLVFYTCSTIAIIYIIYKEKILSNISGLWEAYPQSNLSFTVKFYYLIQIAYWIHCFPELYFQKVKREELLERIQYYVVYLIFLISAYVLNLSQLALILQFLHYTSELLFHLSRLFYYAEKHKIANPIFKLWNVIFVSNRLATITISVLTLWYGMSKTSITVIDFENKNFNTLLVRVGCLVALFGLQSYIMWNFINFHLRRLRDRKEAQAAKKLVTSVSPKKKKTQNLDDENEDVVGESSNSENGNVLYNNQSNKISNNGGSSTGPSRQRNIKQK